MISYQPLWKIIKERSISTYALREKGGISGSTILRIQAGDSVSTNTLDALCKFLDCTLPDIVEYIPDEK